VVDLSGRIGNLSKIGVAAPLLEIEYPIDIGAADLLCEIENSFQMGVAAPLGCNLNTEQTHNSQVLHGLHGLHSTIYILC
jgi:hypothetical protein